MALRTIVLDGDPILRKVCRPVEKFDDRLAQLLDDMAETMHEAEGAGLAAPQVGVMRSVVVVDVGDDYGVIELNQEAAAHMTCEKRLVIIAGATHLFEEPGAMDQVVDATARWLKTHLAHRAA